MWWFARKSLSDAMLTGLLPQRVLPAWPFWSALAAVVLIKLVAIRGDDIAVINSSLDDLWFLRKAEGVYWGRSRYGALAFVKEPVYPLFVGISAGLGLPLRLFTEVAYLAAGAFLARSLVRGWAQVAVFATIAWHPLAMSTFNRATYDTLYVTLLLLACALLARHLRIRAEGGFGDRWALGLALGALWLSRPERVLTVALIGGAIAVDAIRLWRSRGFAGSGRDLIRGWRWPLGCVVALSFAVMTLNWARWRTFAITDMSASGYQSAYRALASITPPKPIRRVPVTAAVRRLAYQYSPTFASLEPHLEGEIGSAWAAHGETPGEIGGGWFCWALRDAVAAAGHYRSARDSEAFYAAIAREIRAAQDAGQLPRRIVLSTYVDPAFSVYATHLMPSWRALWAHCWRGTPPTPLADELKTEMFDRIAWRRAPASGPTVLIEERPDTPTPILGAMAHGRNGEDVVLRQARQGRRLILSWSDGSEVSAVTLHMQHGPQRVAVERLITRGTLDEVPGSPRVGSVHGVKPDVGQVIRKALWQAHGILMPGLLYAGGLAAVIACWIRRRRRDGTGLALSFALVVTAVALTRLALFTLIDAASYRAMDDRYLLPASVLLGVVAIWSWVIALWPAAAVWSSGAGIAKPAGSTAASATV